MKTESILLDSGVGVAAKVGFDTPSAQRRLMLAGFERWQIIGRLRQTATGDTAVRFAHANAPSTPLLSVDDGGQWTLSGSIEVSTGEVRVEHPVLFSACSDHEPSIPNGTTTRVSAAATVHLAVVDSPPTNSVSCTIAVGGVGEFGGELPAKPQVPPGEIVVAMVEPSGAWTLRKTWQLFDELRPQALTTVDFAVVTPDAQVLGYQGSSLAYRTPSGSTLTLMP